MMAFIGEVRALQTSCWVVPKLWFRDTYASDPRYMHTDQSPKSSLVASTSRIRSRMRALSPLEKAATEASRVVEDRERETRRKEMITRITEQRAKAAIVEVVAAENEDQEMGHTAGDDIEANRKDGATNNLIHYKIGALQAIPKVDSPSDTANSAIKRAHKVVYKTSIKNTMEKERKRLAQQMTLLSQCLTKQLGIYTQGFPERDRLPPFEAVLLDLSVGAQMYDGVLKKIRALRGNIGEVGKSFAHKATATRNLNENFALRDEGFSVLPKLFMAREDALLALREMSYVLRRLPLVDPELPTVTLVGAPNVGKSSLVKHLSSGVPEVQNYPFTTKSIIMGHFFLDNKKHQVTDTPGLLMRRDEARNKMELLTLAALQYLPSTVLYVIDLTEECGTSVADQWNIRKTVRERFPDKTWIDVFSKADILADEFQAADSGAFFTTADDTCVEGGRDVDDVQNDVQKTLASGVDLAPTYPDTNDDLKCGGVNQNDVRQKDIGSEESSSSSSQLELSQKSHSFSPERYLSSGDQMLPASPAEHSDGTLDNAEFAFGWPDSWQEEREMRKQKKHGVSVTNAVDFILQLPDALRVSSITKLGLNNLKSRLIQELTS